MRTVAVKEQKERSVDKLSDFLEFFIIERLGYRSIEDYWGKLQESTGKEREDLISLHADITHFYLSRGKPDSDHPQAKSALVKSIEDTLSRQSFKQNEYSDIPTKYTSLTIYNKQSLRCFFILKTEVICGL